MSSNMANEELIQQAQDAEKSGKFSKAVSLYRQMGDYRAASDAAHRGKMYDEALDMCIATGDFEFAARYAENMGLSRDAIGLYMKMQNEGKAKEVAKKAGVFNELFPKKGFFSRQYNGFSAFDESIRRMQRRGDFKTAKVVESLASAYSSAQQHDSEEEEDNGENPFRRIQRLKQEGNLEAAIAVALDDDEYPLAMELARKAGNLRKAEEIVNEYCSDDEVFSVALLYREAKDYAGAARVIEATDNLPWLIELYKLSGNIAKAAEIAEDNEDSGAFPIELYRQANNPLRAIEIAEWQEDYTLAMEIAFQNNMPQKAAELAESKDALLAVHAYRIIGNIQKAAELAEENEFNLLAMELYKDAGNEAKVMEIESDLYGDE